MQVLKWIPVLWTAGLIMTGSWALAQYALGRLMKIGISRVKFGMGPGPKMIRDGVEWSMGVLPLGGFVSFTASTHKARIRSPPAPGESREVGIGRSDAVTFEHTADEPGDAAVYRRSLGFVLVLVFVPWVVPLALTVPLLGADRALEEFVTGLKAFLAPIDLGQRVAAFAREGAAAPFGVTVGIVITKMVAMNLLPLPMFAGGAPLQWFMHRYAGEGVRTGAVMLSLLVVLGLLGYVGWHFVTGAVEGAAPAT